MILHERWFTEDDRYPVQLDAFLSSQTWVPTAVAVGITALAILLWQWRGRRDLIPGPLAFGMRPENYAELISWMPLAIGLHAAVPLLVAGTQRWLFVPSMPLTFHLIGGILGLAQIVIALAFFYGALTRPAAVALVMIWALGMLIFGAIEPLEQVIFVGIAFFLFASGRGPLAFDMSMERLHRPIDRLVPLATTALRVLTGLGIVIVAFTEKLANVPMGLAFLERYPFNFLTAIGIGGVDDRLFILLAGTVELLFGLLLISGVFTRLIILIVWLPFNLTLPFLGWTELIGHLPIYGVMALLLVTGSDRRTAQAALIEGIHEHEAMGSMSRP